MGFKSFKRYNYRLSTLLNISKNCSYDSTMTGMKIAIIFFAIAMISATANAAPLDKFECIKKYEGTCHDLDCVSRRAKECGLAPTPMNGKGRQMAPQVDEECAKKIKACNGSLQCVLQVMKECGIERKSLRRDLKDSNQWIQSTS